MGESIDDILDLAFTCREQRMDSIPINFLHPISGTPMGTLKFLTPMKCLKTLCLFRFLNPTSEIRAAGGRDGRCGPPGAVAVHTVSPQTVLAFSRS